MKLNLPAIAKTFDECANDPSIRPIEEEMKKKFDSISDERPWSKFSTHLALKKYRNGSLSQLDKAIFKKLNSSEALIQQALVDSGIPNANTLFSQVAISPDRYFVFGENFKGIKQCYFVSSENNHPSYSGALQFYLPLGITLEKSPCSFFVPFSDPSNITELKEDVEAITSWHTFEGSSLTKSYDEAISTIATECKHRLINGHSQILNGLNSAEEIP